MTAWFFCTTVLPKRGPRTAPKQTAGWRRGKATVRCCSVLMSFFTWIELEGAQRYSPCGYGVRTHNMDKKSTTGLSPKEAAKDVPSWAKGQRPLTTENGRQFAERLLDDKYGKGNYPTGPGSEFNKIKKWGDRAFE